ncbi:uncharacterized protein LOC106167169 [Lingula anatina]|uniref:Uncharacterized protein LOC106167169 n=1 Tax=Lingula anatina TaxID=7574 RepID=A0A1S3ITC0_LINAN|nr:uncharacterized protein LOC106167169 [Lingula anatina]|eukprot:XP_013401333.1 uncharacterized protein LOC106167169 [Lingula anatina]
MGTQVIVGVVLVLCLNIYAVLSIRCYKCNSNNDPGCADFFSNQTYELHTCEPDQFMCRKLVQETYYQGKWDVRYIRSCARLGEVGADEGRWCQERTGTYRIKVKYCHCVNKDGCNAATRTYISYLTFPVLYVIQKYVPGILRGL